MTPSTPAPPVEPARPDTQITSGPTGWLPYRSAQVSFSATEGVSTYDCRFDGTPIACAFGTAQLQSLQPGTHTFTVAASGDLTPDSVTFAVPYDDTALSGARGWKRIRSGAAYGGGYAQARRRGSALTYQLSGARELALLVRTGQGYGAVKVYLDQTLLATVHTAGGSGSRNVPLASWSTPRSGTLRIVTTTGKTVRIDGLGVSSSPF